MRKSPNHSPRVAAKRVPVLRLPVRHQAIARAIRPPSSGKAGTRLKTRTSRLMLPSQTTMAAMPEVWVFSWVSAAWRTWSPPASARPMIAQTATIAAVTSGPATAILNSVAGVSESLSRRATPPNIQSVIEETSIPFRAATKA